MRARRRSAGRDRPHLRSRRGRSEEIGDWIAADDPRRAQSFVAALVERCLSLARHPRRFPAVRTVGGCAIRKLAWRRYLIFYRVSGEEVEIVRVGHGAQDWAAILREE